MARLTRPTTKAIRTLIKLIVAAHAVTMKPLPALIDSLLMSPKDSGEYGVIVQLLSALSAIYCSPVHRTDEQWTSALQVSYQRAILKAIKVAEDIDNTSLIVEFRQSLGYHSFTTVDDLTSLKSLVRGVPVNMTDLQDCTEEYLVMLNIDLDITLPINKTWVADDAKLVKQFTKDIKDHNKRTKQALDASIFA
jgi:hypothetical protein